MTRSITESGASEDAGDLERRLIDPRGGDVEDDAASPAQRSLLAIASSVLVEISLPKLLFAWIMSLVLPAVLLGLAPLAVTVWFASLSAHVKALTEIGAALVLAASAAIGWLAWRPFLRIAESNFWALNALVVQPGYLLGAELLRHLAERAFAGRMTNIRRARLRAASSAAAGVIMCACAIVILVLVWPYSRWTGTVAELALVHRLIVPMIANAVVLVTAYLAAASLVWGFADATMDQPADFPAFDVAPAGRHFRIAHLSDLHTVGERYGFRIESGRRGPRGNARLCRALERLAEIHATRPLDLILISGDMTDAGRATEWAEFLDAIARYPALIARMIVLPGNHDLNIVDRANPARLDLPFSPGKRLRQMRTLSAIAAVQGDRVHIANVDDKPMRSLNEALAPYRTPIANFAEHGGLRLAMGLGHIFGDQFPMIVLPGEPDGLGVAILNSNTESHFSFTNALGVISAEQARRLVAALDKFPDAAWIIALHHHLLEYPMPVAFSERVGTALVNGSWFVRKLKPFASRIVVMHGHRHTDWIGTCGSMKIISAPSPVMGADDAASTHFYIHTLVRDIDGRLCLIAPERVEISRPMPSA
ncbi:metallophosphoesterase [Bradyrhizobium sp. ARR65]|uniref:metallophosphoesterase n=1 Tax=Bradyrhizobium sp. ARR65 TaxID=1040989 RepID=UPI00046701C9|nr:metallophosphoesterase [Bradyrhizobium sp. ARR65]